MIQYRITGCTDMRIARSAYLLIPKSVNVKCLLVFFLFLLYSIQTAAQCPPNLGFETGTFDNWTCISGKIDSLSPAFITSVTGPRTNRHTIFKNTFPQQKDRYGGFPVNCPNGSNYSIRLGNDSVGGQIDGVSYTVTIPADKPVYSIIYNYAVVLQNPNHNFAQQPRFTAKVFDVGSNQYINCSSFDFSASANLPGFKLAKGTNGNTSVYYKSWSPVTIKLVGYAGRTVKLEFTVNDCTLGGHFGYAYLDINEDCSTPISGNIVCLGSNSTLLTGPFGFKDYRWYDSGFTNLLGGSNTLTLSPIPAAGTVFALEVQPFPGSGCVDTLYTSIENSPVPFQFHVIDTAGACPPLLVDLTTDNLTAGSTQGLKFSYFIDATQEDYVPNPKAVDTTGMYFIKATNDVGCIDLKPIQVIIDTIPVISIEDPPVAYYPNKVDITNISLLSGNLSGLSYSYWMDAAATISIADPKALGIAGIYYIEAASKFGCSVVKPVQVVFQIPPPPNAFSPNNDGINDLWLIPGLAFYPQCSVDVYDRYGRIVFHSTGYSNPWDGKINGKSLPTGTYYYVIKATEKLSPMSGSITIIL